MAKPLNYREEGHKIMKTEILKTGNQDWGFFGTTKTNYSDKETQKRWNEAFKTLIKLSGKPAIDIREYLDSRSGRHLADSSYKENVKEIIEKNYFKWIEKDLFDDNNKIIKNKDKTMFGTPVLNEITGKKDILLYTFENPNRIHKDYATCIDKNENIYDIRMDFLTTIEE